MIQTILFSTYGMLSFSLSMFILVWCICVVSAVEGCPPGLITQAHPHHLIFCVFVFVYLCICVFVYLCICVCVFVFVYLCLCICVVSAVERCLPGLITSAHSHNRILYLAWFFAQFSKTKLDFAICMLLVCIGFITMNRSYLIYHHHNTCVQCFDQASAVLRISMLAAIAFSCVFPTDPNLIRCSARCW